MDISRGGLLMYVPASAPLQAGHVLTLAADAGGPAAPAEVPDGHAVATVVRVDRSKLLHLGQLIVGARFEAGAADR